jgi:hypothetical protein
MNQIAAIQTNAGAAASQAAAAQTNKQTEDAAQAQQTAAAGATAAQPVSQPGTDYSPAYKVEISEEGSQLNAAASQTGQAGETGESDEDSDTTNLATYSDTQLAQMLANGQITQSQYALEMARRQAEKQAEDLAAGQQPANNIAE